MEVGKFMDFKLLDYLMKLWMTPLNKKRKEYNKSRILNPKDNDWRRY